MQKIQNNVVIDKCIDCKYHCYDEQDKKKGTIHCARNYFKTVDRNSIDKDCPLQDVEVLHFEHKTWKCYLLSKRLQELPPY